jgi:uncharacterized protein
MLASQLPLLQLFQRLRQQGMKLTIEQYDLLRQSLDLGFGLDWERLERVCRLLWVKPSLNYDEMIFRQEFANFRQQHQDAFQQYVADREVQQQTEPESVLGELPKLPRRSWETEKENIEDIPEPRSQSNQPTEEYGLGAIDLALLGKSPRRDLQFEPWAVPISLEQVLQTWKKLRAPVTLHQHEDVDWEATIERINREGFLGDLVMRPWVKKGADLLLLVDEGSGMVPYGPVWQPWIQAIEEQRITPAQMYYFSTAVSDSLYDWYQPLQAEALGAVLMRLHPQRSVVVILSDAGAATNSDDADRVASMQKMLCELGRAARAVIWLNPVPVERWMDTSANKIAQWMASSQALSGTMLPFDRRCWAETLPLSNALASSFGHLAGGKYGR